MTIFFTICAVLGCTVLACQFFLTVTGLSEADDLDVDGHDIGGPDGAHDAPEGHADSHAHGSNWFFGVISFRTVTAGLCGPLA